MFMARAFCCSSCWAGDGALLATAGIDHAIRLWSAQTGAPRGARVDPDTVAYHAAFTPDGAALAIATENDIRLLSIPSLQRTTTIPAVGLNAIRITFSADGRTMAAGGHGNLAVW